MEKVIRDSPNLLRSRRRVSRSTRTYLQNPWGGRNTNMIGPSQGAHRWQSYRRLSHRRFPVQHCPEWLNRRRPRPQRIYFDQQSCNEVAGSCSLRHGCGSPLSNSAFHVNTANTVTSLVPFISLSKCPSRQFFTRDSYLKGKLKLMSLLIIE